MKSATARSYQQRSVHDSATRRHCPVSSISRGIRYSQHGEPAGGRASEKAWKLEASASEDGAPHERLLSQGSRAVGILVVGRSVGPCKSHDKGYVYMVLAAARSRRCDDVGLSRVSHVLGENTEVAGEISPSWRALHGAIYNRGTDLREQYPCTPASSVPFTLSASHRPISPRAGTQPAS